MSSWHPFLQRARMGSLALALTVVGLPALLGAVHHPVDADALVDSTPTASVLPAAEGTVTVSEVIAGARTALPSGPLAMPATAWVRSRFTLNVRLPATVAPKRGKRPVLVQTRRDGVWTTIKRPRIGKLRTATLVTRAGKVTGVRRYRLLVPRQGVQPRWRSGVVRVKVVARTATPDPTTDPTADPSTDPTSGPSTGPTTNPVDDPTSGPTPDPIQTEKPTTSLPPGPAWDPFETTNGAQAPGSTSDWTWMIPTYQSTWPDCRVIRWAYDPTGSYGDSLTEVKRSFARISAISGLRFRYVGDQRSVASTDYDIGVLWAPSSSFSSGVIGQASVKYSTGGAVSSIKSATITFNSSLTLSIGIEPPPGGMSTGQLFQHEIMHAVGLGHAAGNSQIMYPTLTSKNPVFGAGDRMGLATVGTLTAC